MSKIKHLFSTPLRAVISIIVMIAIAGVIAGCFVFVFRTAAQKRAIGESRAEQIALADAGEKASQAKFGRTEFSFDDGQFVYEVEFFTDNGEYEYTIAASDGTIIDRDIEKYSVPLQNNKGSYQDSAPDVTETVQERSEAAISNEPASGTGVTDPQQNDIGIDRAKEIALEHAGLDAENVAFTEAKPDREDGIIVYEIEFINGKSEYEYKIQASDGKILEYDVDYNHHSHDHY